MKSYDVAIIGGGPAGYTAAEILAGNGKRVALIELCENKIGGTCLNEGCIPVKSLIESADLYDAINHCELYGLSAHADAPDMMKIRYAVQLNIDALRKGILHTLRNDFIEIIYGRVRFQSKNILSIELSAGAVMEIEAADFIIASGSSVRTVDGIVIDEKKIYSSAGAISMDALPENLLIIGGGYIGCEFASLYHKLGAAVTLVEYTSTLLGSEDAEISRTLCREFKKRNINVMTQCSVADLSRQNGGIMAVIDMLSEPGIRENLSFDAVIVAVGRVPNISSLNLEAAGVALENGFIAVNGSMQTSVKNIYAAGDVIATPMLAHTAYREGTIAACAILEKTPPAYNRPLIPRIVFTDPQIGCCGMTEDQAKESGGHYKVVKQFYKSNGKALIHHATAGFVKLIYNTDDRKLCGAMIIGAHATEIIHELAAAMEAGMTIDLLANVIHGHPTLSELIGDALN